MKIAALATIGLGILLLVLSALWTVLFPPTNAWTQEKAAELDATGNEATRVQLALEKAQRSPSMHSGQSAAELKEQFDELNAKYDALYAEFKSVSETPQTVSGYLKWTGVGLALVGGVMTLAMREP